MSKLPVNTGGLPEDEYKPGDYSKAAESDITTPEQDEKIKKLDAYFDQKIQAHLTVLTANLQEHASKIDMILSAIQQSQNPQQQQIPPQETQQQPPPAPGIQDFASLPESLKGELLTGIAQIIQAWKGGNSAPQEDYFSTMSKQITMNMLQAGVDGIMKNVYDTYNPAPPRNPLARPQGSQEHRVQ